MFKRTCFDVWREEKERLKVLTLCKALDDQLGGGVAAGLVTEFCGAPGSGKTQMCLQLCINVQFPKEVGGINGKAIYLDTNQGFSPERLNEMAHCTEKRFQRAFQNTRCETALKSSFTALSLMENVTYLYCANYVQLKAAVLELRQILSKDMHIKLILIDSFSFPLRCIEDVGERTALIYVLLTELQQLAIDFQNAIVITNELTTRLYSHSWKICPALGESHAHKINQRIILTSAMKHEQRHHVALLDKSHMLARVAVPFVINQSGIRGVS